MNAKRICALLALLFVLLGSLCSCNKDRYILDGPGMVNPEAWDYFSVSRYGDSYAEHNFSITVTRDSDGYIVRGTLLNYENEEEGILLPKSACQQIDALDPAALPDLIQSEPEESDEELAFPLDAHGTEIEVGYSDGRLVQKVDKDSFSIEVYEIVAPYFEEN